MPNGLRWDRATDLPGFEGLDTGVSDFDPAAAAQFLKSDASPAGPVFQGGRRFIVVAEDHF